MKRIRCIIHGRIQGCGFRDFCWRCARSAGTSGWAANDPASMTRVVVEVQGGDDEIKRFLEMLQKGNGYCRVDAIESRSIEVVELETGFKARWKPG